MPKRPPPRSIELTDPRALRAVAHPLRLRLLGLLRREGPLTATRAGELVGESAASCSFHLRQLAKYGLAEEAGGGVGRERPWRATAMYTSWSGASADPAMAHASAQLERVIAERHFEQVLSWIDTKAGEPAEWQEAALFSHSLLYLTPDELARIGREIVALFEPYVGRTSDRDDRPAASRAVHLIQLGFPVPPDEPAPGA